MHRISWASFLREAHKFPSLQEVVLYLGEGLGKYDYNSVVQYPQLRRLSVQVRNFGCDELRVLDHIEAHVLQNFRMGTPLLYADDVVRLATFLGRTPSISQLDLHNTEYSVVAFSQILQAVLQLKTLSCSHYGRILLMIQSIVRLLYAVFAKDASNVGYGPIKILTNYVTVLLSL